MRILDSAAPLMLAALAAAVAARPAEGGDVRTAPDLAVAFVLEEGAGSALPSGDALMDVGPASAAWHRSHRRAAAPSSVIRRRVGVKVTSRSGRRGFVRLRAFASGAEAPALLRVDGALLGAAPRLVDAQAPIGSTVSHVIEIEVLASEAAGPFSADIVWEVEEP
jgi:hypothetical protein